MSQQITSVKDFIDWVEQRKGRLLLYRGLADAAWEVESAACRRIKNSEGEASPQAFQSYIEQLLDRAGLQGFRKRGGGELSELELLAQLQHNGAATCLIDFTSDPLVALWFACWEKTNKAGQVVAVATDDLADFSVVSHEDLEKPIKEFLNQGRLWKWEPSGLSGRAVAQHLFFVFGEERVEERYCEKVEVDGLAKRNIREELKEKFGIAEERLFSDFTGFALSNMHDKPYSGHTAEDYFSLGLTLYQQGDLEKAIDVYDQAIELNPYSVRAYNNRGNVKRALRDSEGAIADYDRAVALNPQSAEAYNNRGNAKQDLGDHQGAMADYDQTIALNPQSAEAYNNRGNAKQNLGDSLGAIADYDRAVALNPQYAIAYNNRGIVKRALDDPHGAMTDYDQAIALNPQSAEAYNNRGNVKRALGDSQGAIADYGQAIALNPRYATAYNNRGIAKRASGDLRGAIADYDQTIALNPHSAEVYKNRGIAKRALGDETGAKEDFDRASEIHSRLQPPES